MFLTDQQFDLIERAYQAPVDLLEANLCTVAALRTRGIVDIRYRTSAKTWTHVALTPTGVTIAQALPEFKQLPRFKEVLRVASPHKRSLKWMKRHDKA